MPLVKIFARNTMAKAVPLAALQAKLCDIWGTTPSTTKLMLQRVDDWTDESFQEDCYVDIRAKGNYKIFSLLEESNFCSSIWLLPEKNRALSAMTQLGFLFRSSGTSERTKEVVLDSMKKIQQAFREHDLIANVRLETYEGERYFHLPPTK